jgi:DNA topoisomerase-1
MAKNLVIVESPAKAKTINRILGKGYDVKSCMGHVRDLPKKRLGVDIDHGFKPKYVVVKGRKQTIQQLKQAAGKSETVYLAPDPDREGEAIAWHLQELLSGNGKGPDFARVQYNEITPGAVKEAFANPGEIDMNRVNAQQARRILDRIVGYKVSPILWRHIRKGLSAGRVQSVALRLLCEKEKQIDDFVPEEYWLLDAVVRKLVVPLDPFTIHLSKVNGKKPDIKTKDDANRIKNEVSGRSLKVRNIEVKDSRRKAPPPFMTSTLQQTASSRLGFSPRRTMTVAQKLYEGVDLGKGAVGLITYMRTDSVAVSKDAVNSCRDYVASSIGKEFLPEKPNLYRSRTSAQQAHEAIRPTDVRRTPDQLKNSVDPSMLRLYKLIWSRFVASQMKPAIIEKRTVTIEAVRSSENETEYLFDAGTAKVKFQGFLKVTRETEGSPVEKQEPLPDLSEGEPLECIEWKTERKETQPPQRYSEASLVRALERNGVGRPSTYAQIISTLHSRKYVTSKKKTLIPTELGRQVSDLLVANLNQLFAVGFTADMEKSLDKVEEGNVAWDRMLDDFYSKFEEWLSHVKMPVADEKAVADTLSVLENVSEWMPAASQGKRVYDDRKFVESIKTQLDEGKKPVSKKQFETLLKIGWKYRDEVPRLIEIAEREGYKDFLEASGSDKPDAGTVRKLEILGGLEMDDKTAEFINSLKQRVDSGRALSDGQKTALNKTLVGHSDQIQGFEQLKQELGIKDTDVADREESRELIGKLAAVENWREPVKRGKRTYDDRKFYESLKKQFEQRGVLSERQRAALKKMDQRYRKKNEDETSETGEPAGENQSS